jgi:transcriptional regulator of acetoin/glycerol metabolism
LSKRTNFQKVAQEITADLSPQHCVSKVAIIGLRTDKWSGNLRQLRSKLQLVTANAPETVIREDINSALASSSGRAPTPCPKCANSPVRAESCVSILKTWLKTVQKVSHFARRLDLSRITVFKYIAK